MIYWLGCKGRKGCKEKKKEKKMFKTDKLKAAKILDSLRPSLIFVTVPFAIDAASWLEQFRWSHSLIDANAVLRRDQSQNRKSIDAYIVELRDLIRKRRDFGSVLVYGFISSTVLNKIMTEEYAHVWFYPNKQTTYYENVKTLLESTAEPDMSILEECFGVLPDFPNIKGSVPALKKLVVTYHDYQKRIYSECLAQNPRIFVVLV